MAEEYDHSYVSKITLDHSVNTGLMIQEGWLGNPSLTSTCRDLYLQEIRENLRLKYRDKLSCIHPIVEDVVKLNISRDQFVVQPEVASFQLSSSSSSEGQYLPRDIVDIEDILVTHVDPALSKSTQFFEWNKLILVSGSGGQGKTTQMLKLAVDWSEGSSPILEQFELLFYISLSQNTSPSSTETMVCDEAKILPVSLKEKLKFVLENKTSQSKYLYIIDGYESMRKNAFIEALIDGHVESQATVIICGRPYWMKDFKSHRSADNLVDIKGISEQNVELLAFNLLNGDRQSVNELMDICRKYIMDTSLMRIPLFSILCCYIFHANHGLQLEVCNHVRPTSITELFHAILRLLLMIYLKRRGKAITVHFNHSPFDESGEDIPGGVLRLLYQISKMSFAGIKRNKHCFSAKDLKEFFIEPDELCHLGIMVCTTDATGQCEGNNPRFTFQFKHRMFQEYMAGLYMAKEASAMDEVMDTILVPLRKVSGDDGYSSENEDLLPSEIKPVKQKSKKRRFPLFKWPRKKSEYDLCSSEQTKSFPMKGNSRDKWRNIKSLKNAQPQEHDCMASSLELDLQLPDEDTSFNLDISGGSANHASAASDSVNDAMSESPHPLSFRTLSGPVTKKCLYNLLNPFQTAAVFACGASSAFTKNLLDRCNPFTLAKVCKWNNNKFDVGYEAALFSESQDPSLAIDFFKYFKSKDKQDRVPTNIQFPSPYDEYATCVLAQSISEAHVKNLLHHWYNVDLQSAYLTGANIVHSDSDTLELNDPCLFEMLLLHRFCHMGVSCLTVTGNYFPGFPELSVAFPNVRELYFDGVNIPSPPRDHITTDETLKFVSLSHLKLVNVHASFPFCTDLLHVLKHSPQLKTLVLQKLNCDGKKTELLSEIKSLVGLQELSLVKMNLCFEDFVHSDTANLSVTTITDILGELRSLTSLDLGYNNIGIAITGLILALRKHKLSQLILRKCRIAKISLTSVGPLLGQFSYLEHLDMSSNVISDKLADLLHWLKDCPKLQVLELRDCSLSPDHFYAASNTMLGFGRLDMLDISHNNLSSAARDFLQTLPITMKKLVLTNCNILSMDAISLAPALRRMANLEDIDLQDNPIHGGVEPIMLALKNCKQLRVMNVRKCQLKPSHFLVMAKLLPEYRKLQELTIGMNTCCDETKDARSDLVKSLLKCKKLQCLRSCVLIGDPFCAAQVEQLKQRFSEVTIFQHPK